MYIIMLICNYLDFFMPIVHEVVSCNKFSFTYQKRKRKKKNYWHFRDEN